MHRHFAGWSLRRRIIALAAAYALALGAVIASWAAGSAAAALTATGPATVICHHDTASGPAPSQNDGSGHVCVDSCCVGCVLLTAALPPPPVKALVAPQSAARPMVATPGLGVGAASSTRAHQSRAPPLRV